MFIRQRKWDALGIEKELYKNQVRELENMLAWMHRQHAVASFVADGVQLTIPPEDRAYYNGDTLKLVTFRSGSLFEAYILALEAMNG